MNLNPRLKHWTQVDKDMFDRGLDFVRDYSSVNYSDYTRYTMIRGGKFHVALKSNVVDTYYLTDLLYRHLEGQ